MGTLSQTFLVGAATAAHQVEGNSIYSDFWVMENLKHSDFAEPSGLAVDHYNRYQEDIRLLADAGMNAYRFSIEWARIEPEEGKYDLQQIKHYRKMLRTCRELGVTPIVTLHHFSSPAWLIRKGGWCNALVVDAFARYVRTVVSALIEDLEYICTINEANMGYQLHKIMKDMRNNSRREGDVQVGINIDMKKILLSMLEQGFAFHCNPLKVNTFLRPRSENQEKIVMCAHQAACQVIKSISPKIKAGLTLSLFNYQPSDGGELTAEGLWQEDFGQYLPFFEHDDFLGVQNYSRKIVGAKGVRVPTQGTPQTLMGYEDYPASIGNVLRKVSETFKGKLLVTENGICTDNDIRRCAFIKEAFHSVMAAKADGGPVIGYLYWSLLDNFEWQAGYKKPFGLIAVDGATQKRYPKDSLYELGKIASANKE